MRLWGTIALLGLLMGSASAEPPPDAKQLYVDGQAAFDVAHYDDAIDAWQRSYELSRAPGLLYNLAQAYRLRAHAGDCAHASAQYSTFVQLSAPSPQRTLAEGYIGQLATCASVPSVDAQPHTSRKPELAVALGGTGVVALAAGLYLGHRATAIGDDVTRACATSCDWGVEKGKDADGRRDASAGRALDVVGVIAIAGGGALLSLAHRENEIAVAPISLRSRDNGVVLTWRREW